MSTNAVDEALAGASPVSEKAMYLPDSWVAYDYETGSTAPSAVHAALAGFQHFVRHLVVTADLATSAVNVVTISDGANTIFRADLPTTLDASPFVVNFGPGGLPGQPGDAVTAACTASGNSANTCVWISGYTSKNP
jgi:hypothetical protein